MTITKAIQDFIKTCPFLEDFEAGVKNIGIDRLDKDIDAYMVQAVPAQAVIKKYIDGSSTRQHVFVFATRAAYTTDEMRQLDNIGFFERFSDWLEEQTDKRELPNLGDSKRVAKKIEALSGGYVFDQEANTAQYQMQCRLVYEQEV